MRIASGPRLCLRDMALHDLDAWRHWMQPGRRWRELDGPYYQQDVTAPSIDDAIEKHRARITADEPLPPVRERALIADAGDDSALGHVSRYWISRETNWAALGVVLYDDERWGQGLGFEALGLWTDYQFEHEPSFVRLGLRTWSGNTGMMRLATKLGFQQEACFRKARIVEGAYYDSLGYGVLREEWTARFPNGFAASLSSP
ncbi:MAG: GNAT family protein [Planctomycetota bacterium]|nr:GNAT family protein [Planctomycetota bacterium]